MTPNSFVYSHMRKRRSTPTSPVSPPDQPGGAIDPAQAPSSPPLKVEKPATERQNSSSRFRVPSFLETALDLSFDPTLTIPSRFSDEHKRHKPTSPPEHQRPSTSAAASRETDRALRYFATAPAFDSSPKTAAPDGKWPLEPASSPSELLAGHSRLPRIWREHASSDNLPTSAQSPKTQDATFYAGREDLRNASTSSLMTDRGGGAEDGAGPKMGSSRFGKGRLNLLNPSRLLARRRASQNQSKPDEFVSMASLAVPPMPDDYDPRIRGKIFHDFSEPRARRLQSYQGQSTENSPVNEPRPFEDPGRRASDLPGLVDGLTRRNAPLPQHSPLFKEHFNEDRQALQPGSKGYLHSLATSPAFRGDSGPVNLPVFAKKLPIVLPDKDEPKTHDASASLPNPTEIPPIPPPVVVPEVEIAPQNEVVPQIAHPTHPPPPPPVPQAAPLKDQRREHLPKHMTSTSSRFSFQLGGVGSAAQERLLEEKHKQQAALRRPADDPVADDDAQDDDYDDYDLDADDDLEEKIPGVNADVEETDKELEETTDTRVAQPERIVTADIFHFTPALTILSPTTTIATSQPTPRDEMGQVIGFANTTDSPDIARPELPDQVGSSASEPSQEMLNGLGIRAIGGPGLRGGSAAVQPAQRQSDSFDDDMYFDDGHFDFGADEEGEGFDEALFDEEPSQLRDIPAQNAKNFEAAQQRIPSGVQRTPSTGGPFSASGCPPNMPADGKQVSFAEPADNVFGGQIPSNRELLSSGSGQPLPSQRGGLTEGNLAAYHDALVLAANEAAANGRFGRRTSTSQASEDQGSSSQMLESHPGLVSDDSRVDLDHLGAEDDEAFPFDDDLDDDLMIAEANAEVLENDEDGFYGQEFGFYARAPGKGNVEPVNGGYFGPRGGDGIKRSHSGKANFQEPSLTPITEHSEWSKRNSLASIQIPIGPFSAQSVPSPGIVEVLELDLESAAFDDDEMTLGALMKLRSRAWGGSSTSVNSVGGSHNSNSSPTRMASKESGGSSGHLGNGHPLSSSVHSLSDSVGILESEEEGEDDEPGALTAMQNTPRKGSSDPQHPPTPPDRAMQSPVSAASELGKPQARSHSRNSSGAESISYVKDPEGSGRWVLERRRTGDDGEFEIVGREYLAGARI